MAQGYGIARPMPAEDLPGWVRAWRTPPQWAQVAKISPTHWPVLHAGVEHRAWIQEIEEFLRGVRAVPPAREMPDCRFGAWLKAELCNGRAGDPQIERLDQLHTQIHAMGLELIAIESEEKQRSALAGLQELHALRDSLISVLGDVVQRL